MLRVILFCCLVFTLNYEIVLAKSKKSHYANLKNWSVYSFKIKEDRFAFACIIQSKKFSFYLRYTGNEGWVITSYFKPQINLKNGNRSVHFYVDRKYIGSKLAEIKNSDKSLEIILGLDTSILNPMFKGRQLVIKVQNKLFKLNLYGLKRAYHKSLGCWRERMGSVPYVSKKTKNNKANKRAKQVLQNHKVTAYELQKLDLKLKTYLVAMGLNKNFEGYNFYIKPNEKFKNETKFSKSILYLSQTDPKIDEPIGDVVVIPSSHNRLALKSVNDLLNGIVTKNMTFCQKTGIENQTPYFIGQTVEVHTRIMICQKDNDQTLIGHMWLLQTDKYILTASIFLSKDVSDKIGKGEYKKVIEHIAEGLDK